MSKLTYRGAGVDIDAGDALVDRIVPMVARTMRKEVLSGVGGFGALCQIPAGYQEPVLVSGTDGVGTKLKVAFLTGRHDTIGIDLVAMCVNDIACSGAEPLFFLDYFATGRLAVGVAADVVSGIVEGCAQAGCALVGGETAELPGMYADGEYDLAGFAVGVVDKAKIVDGKRIAVGDALIGVASSGLHSNGYSLARRALLEERKLPIEEIGDDLLRPTKIYIKAIRAALAAGDVRGIAHITGGGLVENPPRVVPHDLDLILDESRWPEPPIFAKIAAAGVDRDEMRRTFNLGIGLVLTVPTADVAAVRAAIEATGEATYLIGKVVAGAGEPRVHFRALDDDRT